MQYDGLEKLPARVDVEHLVSSRYPESNHERPLIWEDRTEGIDVIKTTSGSTLRLLSSGQQSPPLRGWGLVITSGSREEGYRWTLYSLPEGAGMPSGPRI